MNFFKTRSRTFTVSEGDPTYKVKYLGNVLTTFVKGEGCVDRPLSILWNNYLANPTLPKEMQFTVTNSGLKAVTKEQGLMEYRCHRIVYSFHHPQYPRLFVWVYRHEGRKLKVEVRCHAVLCKSDAVAKAIHGQLKERLAFALAEFMRDKIRSQNSRRIRQRTQSVPSSGTGAGAGAWSGASLPLRTQLLSVGQHFRPPASLSTGAPSLGAISEELGEAESIPSEMRLTRSEGRWATGGGPMEEEEDDDSAFVFSSPEALDCRLTDIIPSFFVNGREDNRSSDSDSTENFSASNGLRSPLNGTGYRDSLTDSFPSTGTEGQGDLGSGLELFDPELMDRFSSSASLECDDQSIESGFSEQDANDL